ncbi:hypothetical protein GCM10011579_068130 [Streptomyces albiflavescens]|uniref:Uncharacterized protein n=1 Tax=Streptomyces albiflavescens TaxID=1623582 RepID=A0A917Y9N6_9ACTN|nr:hypothetical protein [Streptomyces albiflavescens]GGN81495.1 hypothetical protein GCM10011579_068130 [Streptomyces albiflavescens]
MTEASWVSLVGHVVWPLVVLVLGLTLRRQISGFLSAVGGRITQVSVMSVTIELAVETETVPPWRGVRGADVRGLVAAQNVNDSYFDTLRQSLQVSGRADYFIVDLKSDDRKEWLTSRLYLFTYLLSRMKGVRSVVFTATRGDVARCFLGVAESEELLQALAATQPWLRMAQLQAEAEQVGQLPDPAGYFQPSRPNNLVAPTPNVSFSGGIDEWWQRRRGNEPPYIDPLSIPRRFVELVQWVQPMGAAEPEAGWLRLPDAPGRDRIWEHATWIAVSDLVDGSLSEIIRAGDYVLDDRSWSAEERVRAVAQARGDAVALLDPDRRFDRLIDRRSLLEAVGRSAAEA